METSQLKKADFETNAGTCYHAEMVSSASTQEILDLLEDIEGRKRQTKEFLRHIRTIQESIASLMAEYPLLQAEGCIVKIAVTDGFGTKLCDGTIGSRGFIFALAEKHPELKETIARMQKQADERNEQIEQALSDTDRKHDELSEQWAKEAKMEQAS